MPARATQFFLFLCSLLFALAGPTGCATETGDEVGTDSVGVVSAPATSALIDRLEKAIDQKDGADETLARELSRVGPVLDAKQQAAYVRAYRALPNVAQIDGEYLGSAIELERTLDAILANPDDRRAVMSTVKELKRVGRGTLISASFGPRDLFDAYALLARTPAALGSLRFAVRLLANDPEYAAVRAAGKNDEAIVRDLVVPALPPAFVELLVEKKSSSSALADLKSLLEQANGACNTVIDWIEMSRDLTGAFDRADAVRIRNQPVGKALRVVGAILSIWDVADGVNAALRGDMEKAIKKLVGGGTASVTALADATTALRRIFFGVEKTPWAARVAAIAGKVSAGFGAVMSVVALVGDLEEWDASTSAKVRVVGDLVAVGAAVLALFNVGVAGPVGLLAVGIAIFADLLHEQEIADRERADLRACLPKTGLASDLVDTLIDAEPIQVRTLAVDVGLSAGQMQWVLTTDPWTVLPKHQPLAMRFVGLQVAQEIFGLDANHTFTLLQRVVGNETRPEYRRFMLDTFLRAIEHDYTFTGDLSKRDALDWMDAQRESYLADSSGLPDAWRATFTNARAYLATQ